MPPFFLVLCGIPASGKTTTAHLILSKASAEVYHMDEVYDGVGVTSFQEATERFHADVRRDLANGLNVICDGTYRTKYVRCRLLDGVADTPCKKVVIVLNTPIEECIRRNAERTGRARIPEHIIRGDARVFEQPMLDEGWDEIRVIKN